MDQLLGQLQDAVVKLTQIADLLWPFMHPKDVVVGMLRDNLVLDVWKNFILSTTNIETHGGEFIANSTIRRYEPAVQVVSDAALVLVAMWGSFRIMWGHGLRSQYTARILLPRLLMGAVLINFSLPLLQMVIAASNTICLALRDFATFDDPRVWFSNFVLNPTAGVWDILTTGALALGFDVLAVAYLVRYAILIVLAITAPIAGLLFALPETHHLSKMWASHFMSNLFMQPAQLFVLSVGFALEKDGVTPIHHLFALASLLIVFKIPGALGGSAKVAHKLESTIATGLHHLEHAVAKA
jgi:hypothetical protein